MTSITANTSGIDKSAQDAIFASAGVARANTTTAPGVAAQTTPTASGRPASLVPWVTLGEYGRSFVATATTPAQLRAFHGPAAEVKQPIRVYAGLRSAGWPTRGPR